ncbi:hypothetical protein HDU81_008196 [Chytriomyces hyalinus]|nr:hypothetical protein HDU81_008196 [Chytriomyces hyalinus]
MPPLPPSLPLELWSKILNFASDSIPTLARLSPLSKGIRFTAWTVSSAKATLLVRMYGRTGAFDAIQEFWHLPDADSILEILIRWDIFGGCCCRDSSSHHHVDPSHHALNRCPLFLVCFQFTNKKRCHNPLDVDADLSVRWKPDLANALLPAFQSSRHLNDCILVASRDPNPDILNALLAADCNLSDADVLLKAARQACRFGFPGNLAAICNALEKRTCRQGASLFGSEGFWLLRSAILGGHVQVATLLLSKGVVSDSKYVQEAVKAGNSSMVTVLLSQSAPQQRKSEDPHKTDTHADFFLSLPASCLHTAVLKHFPFTTLQLIISHVKEQLTLSTLELAVSRHSVELVSLLLEAGILASLLSSEISPSVSNALPSRTSALAPFWEMVSVACWDGEFEIVGLLLHHGSVWTCDALENTLMNERRDLVDVLADRLAKNVASSSKRDILAKLPFFLTSLMSRRDSSVSIRC